MIVRIEHSLNPKAQTHAWPLLQNGGLGVLGV